MKVKFSATFEFNQAAPETIRGEVEGSAIPALFARAARQLKKAFPNRQWSSCLILLDRHEAKGSKSLQSE